MPLDILIAAVKQDSQEMVVCVWVKNSFYSIIYVFTFILKLYCIYHFLCFPSVTYRSDIDECSSGSHDCHQNAKCVNAAGHFNCSCQTGFTGNGRLCLGKKFLLFHNLRVYLYLETILYLPFSLFSFCYLPIRYRWMQQRQPWLPSKCNLR